jgi:hypothetical protein
MGGTVPTGGAVPTVPDASSGPVSPHNAQNLEKNFGGFAIFPNEIKDRPPTNRR